MILTDQQLPLITQLIIFINRMNPKPLVQMETEYQHERREVISLQAWVIDGEDRHLVTNDKQITKSLCHRVVVFEIYFAIL